MPPSNRLLLILLVAATTASSQPPPAQIELPILTVSQQNRPEVTDAVLAVTGNATVKQSHGCGRKVWQVWYKSSAETPEVTNKDIDVGCNHDQTIGSRRTAVGNYAGDSCQTVATCTDDNCTAATVADKGGAQWSSFLDPQCIVRSNDAVQQHRYGNHEASLRRLIAASPANAQETLNDLYVLMPTKEPTFGDGIDTGSKKFLTHWLWGAVQVNNPLADAKLDTPHDCNDGCQYGRHVKIGYKKASRVMHVYLQPSCDWFTVCTKWEGTEGKCAYGSTVHVQMRNGFVAYESRKAQVPLRLIRDGGADTAVRVDLTLLSASMTGGSYAQLAVTSMFRQRVVGSVAPGEEMMISFSSATCLHKENLGLRAQTDGVKVVIEKKDSDEYKTNVTDTNKDNPKIGTDIQVDVATGGEVPTAAPVAVDPTTPDMGDLTAPPTTTIAPVPPGAAAFVLPIQVTGNETKAQYEGHATWAIFYGWLIGSVAAIAVMGPVMYLCRRSIYSDWYRGIYKRYGCDASGTTGGVTGAAFDGQTTIGAETVGQTTTGGGTTSGGSQMSTVGDTTGGETSTSQATK